MWTWIADVETPRISVLAGGQVDGRRLGIWDQGGDKHFLQRFALRTRDAYDVSTAMRFALEHQNPLVTEVITGGDAFPGTDSSFVTISDPNVLLWALKPAESGIDEGIILRAWNMSDRSVEATIDSVQSPIAEVIRTSHIETPIRHLPISHGVLSTSFAPQQMCTYSLKFEYAVGE